MYRAVIFDIDGTLVDSNDAHAQAWVVALAEAGHHVEVSRVRPLIGKGGDKVLPELTGLPAESPEGRRISDRRSAIFKARWLPRLQPTPGARSLLERLRADGLTLHVATSAHEDEVKALLRVAGAEELMESATSSDDAERSKPDPDIVRAALRRTGCDTAAVVMIGDTPYDVQAATRAGIGIIGVRCGGWGDADLAGALAVYQDPADLLARYDRSPLGPTAPQ